MIETWCRIEYKIEQIMATAIAYASCLVFYYLPNPDIPERSRNPSTKPMPPISNALLPHE
jgi:hypothetical protein